MDLASVYITDSGTSYPGALASMLLDELVSKNKIAQDGLVFHLDGMQIRAIVNCWMEGKPLPPREPEREKNRAAVALSKLGAARAGRLGRNRYRHMEAEDDREGRRQRR